MKIAKILLLVAFSFYGAHMLYWKDYWKPQNFIWDENYHIASAARYLKGVYYMEPHPPLGKLIIALGEQLVGVNNGDTGGFEKWDIIPHQIMNESFSFAGYRFFPTLAALLNVVLFTALVYYLTNSYLLTLALTALPLFDTALILHSRTAMLDSFLIFGVLLTLLAYFVLLRIDAKKKAQVIALSVLMTAAFTFAHMTKLFGLALLMLWPLLFYYRPDLRRLFYWVFPMNFFLTTILSLGIWFIHIDLGRRVEPNLINNGMYFGSDQSERWLLGLEKDSIWNFPRKLKENFDYILHFEKNVSPLDWDEMVITGSYPITWPFGSRPISYRWSRESSQLHRYLYLIPNIWAWSAGLLALMGALVLFIRRPRRTLAHNPPLASLVVLYFSFLIPMCFIHRVLYLYHYLPMLVLTWLMLALVLMEAARSLTSVWRRRLALAYCLIPILTFWGYYNFRNFVYFSAITCHELGQKYYPPFWGMKFQSCRNEELINQFRRQFPNL